MRKAPWLPSPDPGKCDWFDNFDPKIATYAIILDLTPAELSSIAADHLVWNYVCTTSNQWDKFASDWMAYKAAARNGNASGLLGPMPVPPTLDAPPPTVAADIFGRIGAFVARIKKHPNCTEAIMADLGIVGADQVIDLNAMKPVLKLTLQAGHPNVGWKKKDMSGIELWVDRGNGVFVQLAFDTEPDYVDTAPLPAPGASAVWRYKGIYRLHDQQVGQWSDVASISVMG